MLAFPCLPKPQGHRPLPPFSLTGEPCHWLGSLIRSFSVSCLLALTLEGASSTDTLTYALTQQEQEKDGIPISCLCRCSTEWLGRLLTWASLGQELLLFDHGGHRTPAPSCVKQDMLSLHLPPSFHRSVTHTCYNQLHIQVTWTAPLFTGVSHLIFDFLFPSLSCYSIPLGF